MSARRSGTPTEGVKRALRSIPSVETILQALGPTALPRAWVVTVVRREVEVLRRQSRTVVLAEVVRVVQGKLTELGLTRMQPVINGTGVLIHTNLGRAPLAPAAVEAVQAVASGYSNLEFDLGSGQRGARSTYLEQSLALACGTSTAVVVNNCAGALVLILQHLTQGERKAVVISRGELIQIGGGFRIPEILETSGATLREVGTTNRTTLADYARAIGRDTALVLKVHRSNFFMGGFVESPSTADLATLARRRRVPLVEDLGSGALIDTSRFASLDHEPTPREVLRQGADLVCFSGDKLLGGPQAGIVAGRPRLVAGLKRHPFFRALRCDKLVLSALQATLDLYLDRTSDRRTTRINPDLPLLNLLSLSHTQLEERAERLVSALQSLPASASVGHAKGQIGGGTLPAAALDSVTLDLCPDELSVAVLAKRLRVGSPPVLGAIAGGRLRIDLRTVFPEQDEVLAAALCAAFDSSRHA